MNFNGFLNHPHIGHMFHPLYPELCLFDYERTASYEGAWDEYTTVARGLVLNTDGKVIGRGLPKFFNVGERGVTIETLPQDVPQIYEKVDGSFILLFIYNGEIHCTTRGSFNSDQAKWAQNYARSTWDVSVFNPDLSYWFEFIGPSNRVVVEYPQDELVMLGLCNTETGNENYDVVAWSKFLGVRHAERFDFKSVEDAVKYVAGLDANHEGVILAYNTPTGVERYKLKGAEYVNAHMFRFGLSTLVIWRSMIAGVDPITVDTPEEFHPFINRVRDAINAEALNIERKAQYAYAFASLLGSRKEQAQFIMANYKDVSGLAFSLLDGKNIHQAVLRSVRPEWMKM